ncbi:mitochondrial 37S ribosomal protein uS5m SCDLUD_005202 [Saccharomycodes ludwigii]|uniref:mitochondrial 37S ribosomal protein uS5m n=1 Tax=Saccharomycodes ludwigii TaxID=36035 RepID=UPI001E8B243D|nr:hypothetical protein SCDLUD_005202 [Saccharomycodes ludwigii]KAH3898863.1 hypothetical protein SCDLUD_005202 [Saccharomycodes ludwigii]
MFITKANLLFKRSQSTYMKNVSKLYPTEFLNNTVSASNSTTSPLLAKATELAEQAINPIITNPASPQQTFRFHTNVEFAPSYYDDFTKLDPYWDYLPGLPNIHNSDNILPFIDYDYTHQPLPKNTEYDGLRVQIPEGTAVDLKSLASPSNYSRNNAKELRARDIAKRTGFNKDFINKKLFMKPLIMKMVSNQTAKGKIPSFYSLVIVGDKNGLVGIGEGKSRDEMSKAINKAHWDAIRNLTKIPLYENRTIYGDIDYRYHGVKLHLRSCKPGFGLRVNHVIYEIAEICGIKDLSGKIYKSRNVMNVAKGTVEALVNAQKTLDEIALGRGKKIVDVRKIYYSESTV